MYEYKIYIINDIINAWVENTIGCVPSKYYFSNITNIANITSIIKILQIFIYKYFKYNKYYVNNKDIANIALQEFKYNKYYVNNKDIANIMNFVL